MEDFYSGPVLFEDGAVASIFSMNLLQPGALLAYRELGKPAQGIQGDRFGRQIVDGRLTVKNYTTLDKYNGIELYGKYSVDAEGVIPQAEMTLVENGVFKQMLNGREPALNALKSTGSSRFRLPPSEFNSMTAPGTVHVQATKTTKAAKMKDRLMKLAKPKDCNTLIS
ncbi:MAG: metallopeptidase TldD-related protein [Butyricimonas faecihominis]